MDALITKLPVIVDATGRAGGIAAAGGHTLTVEDRIAMAIEKGATGSALSAAVAGLDTSRAKTADTGLSAAITDPVAALRRSATPLDRRLAAAAGGRLDPQGIRAAQDGVLARAADLRHVLTQRLDVLLTQRVSRLSAVRTRVLVVTALGILAAAWLFLALLVSLTGAVRTMVRVAEGIAVGDVEQEIAADGRDELSALARAFGRMIAYLRTAAEGAERIARGDLTERVEPASDRDALGIAFGRMTDDLRTLVGDVAGSAGRLGQASREMADASAETGRAVEEIARAAVDVADGAREQVAAVDRSRDTTEAMAGSSHDSSSRAASTREAVEQALDVAREGERALIAVDEAMGDVRTAGDRAQSTITRLDSTSEEIGGITKTVRSLAEQTNLLALNAAIEAARAGEQGRGFAVVADEVRSLADETDRAGAQIAELVETLQEEMRDSVEAVREGSAAGQEGAARVAGAREAFAAIAATVEEVASGVQEIAAALDELAASAGAVQTEVGTVAEVAGRTSQATEHVSSSAEQTSASAQQVAASARELAGTAEHLEQLVERFALQPA
jgi:methyl-accepting chemotaxis protein